jgi:integrase
MEKMARKPVSVFKRPTTKKGQFRYYIKLWDENTGMYSTPRSAASIALKLGLNEKKYPPTSRTGALLIAQELLKRGGALTRENDPLLADYCEEFWDWERSAYIQGRLARGLSIGREHVRNSSSFIKNYIRPEFPAMKLSELRSYHIEKLMLSLKKEGRLSNRTINEIIHALKTPLKEAYRLGLISMNPGINVQELAEDSKPKGIPSTEELTGILALNLDSRIRCAILLGSVCGLRLGEILALRMRNVTGNVLEVAASWGKLDGLKSTKTGKIRKVPLPQVVKEAMIELSMSNPHGPDSYLMYGPLPDAPCDREVLERGFMNALAQLTLGEKYQTATRAEKTAALQPWRARNITFHSLRHFANAELRGAVPDETLRKLTGHSTEAMTDHYDHTTEADLEALAKAQEARIVPFIKTA